MRGSDNIDRAAWAELLAELLASAGLTPETATGDAGPLDVTPSTMYRWLRQAQGVSAHQVRDIARVLDYPPVHALVKVGFLTAAEAGIAGPARPKPATDPLLQRIAGHLTDANLPEATRAELHRIVQQAFNMWLGLLKSAAQRPARTDRSRR